MQTEIIDEAGFLSAQDSDSIQQAIAYAARDISGREDFELSLTVTDDDGIQSINREFRSIDSPTDILSFPLLSFDDEDPYKDAVDPDTGLITLGDIILNYNRALEQSKEYGHSAQRELCYLCVHSVLHLFGFDHMTNEDKSVMRAREEEIMNGINLPR